MRKHNRQAARQGSVLMEYVMLTTVIILPLLGVQKWLIDPSGGQVYQDAEKDAMFNSLGTLDYNQASLDTGISRVRYGMLGDAFVDWYRRLVTGIALPFP